MKFLILLSALMGAVFSGASVFAKQVEVTCVTKAFSCQGTTCGWYATTEPAMATVNLYRDPNYPKEDAPYEIWRATYQANYDRHLLTLNMEVRDDGVNKPVTVSAKLDAGTVVAESTSLNAADISLRNQNYGRGFTCTSIRAIE